MTFKDSLDIMASHGRSGNFLTAAQLQSHSPTFACATRLVPYPLRRHELKINLGSVLAQVALSLNAFPYKNRTFSYKVT